MESNDSYGLLIALMIGVAIMAACGIISFVLFLVSLFLL